VPTQKQKRKRTLLGIIGVVSALLFIGGLLTQPRWIFHLATYFFPGAIYSVEVEEESAPQKVVALTIDDGPSPETANILAVLEAHNAKATFFNISGNVHTREAIVQRTVTAGHELGNHLTTDSPSIKLSPEDFETNLLTAEQALLPFIQSSHPQAKLHWLRPGMGFYNAKMVETAQRHGYQLVLGSTFPYDTHIHSARFASAFILRTIQPGDIIVLHDGEERGQRTVKTLKVILPVLQAKGYKITTVSGLTDSELTYSGLTESGLTDQ